MAYPDANPMMPQYRTNPAPKKINPPKYLFLRPPPPVQKTTDMNTANPHHFICLAFAALLALACTSASGQTIATALPGCLDGGIVKQGINCGSSMFTFGLSSGKFVVRNIDGQNCCPGSGGDWNSYFQFPAINISGYSSVKISMDYEGDGDFEDDDANGSNGPFFSCTGTQIDNSHDQIVFMYSVDNMPFVTSKYVHGDTAADFTGTWSHTGISGSTLVIRVYASNKAITEIFSFSNLLVTGTPAVVDAGPDITVCGTGAVALSGSGTGTWSGGTGTFSNPGAPNTFYTPGPGDVGRSVTLTYTGATPAPACEPALPTPVDQMVLTVQSRPVISPVANAVSCGDYILPPIAGTNLGSNAAYYTAPNGGGDRLNPGTAIPSSRTLFVFAGTSTCSDEATFSVEVAQPPDIFPIGTQENCGGVFLPFIQGTNISGAAYYTEPDGRGSRFEPGSILGFSTQLFAYMGTPGCSDQESFFVSVLPPTDILPFAPVNACERYVLPAINGSSLSGTQRFYTGRGGTGQAFSPGQVITVSTTLFAFDGTSVCTDEEALEIRIFPRPQLDPIANITTCGSVLLPPISGRAIAPNTAYFTGRNGSGTRILPGTRITTGGTYFAFSSSTGSCSDEIALNINILPQPQLDSIPPQRVCAAFSLPPIRGSGLSGRQGYFTGPNGTGIRLPQDTILRSGGTYYAFDSLSICKSERAFSLNVFPQPQITPLPDTTVCGFFVLPPIKGSNLSGKEAYYTGPLGSGLRRVHGDTLFASTTLYPFDSIALCQARDTFRITVNQAPRLAPVPDTITACIAFSLPVIGGSGLSGGQGYFSGPGGTGRKWSVGEQVRDSVRIYIYDAIGTCTAERPFVVLPIRAVQLDSIPDIVACANYTLPEITGSPLAGNEAFYTGPGGTGQRYLPGTLLTLGGRFFAYGGQAPGCTAQRTFLLTITEGPLPQLSIDNPINCFGDSTGAVRLNVSKGFPPYTVRWWDGRADSIGRNSLPAGIYHITVADSGDCKATASIEIRQPPELLLACSVVRQAGKINGNDGIGEIRISGGTGRYSFQLTGQVGISQSRLSPGAYQFEGLRPGQYTLRARDSLGCEKTCAFSIAEPVCTMEVALDGTPPRCTFAADGSIATRIINGTGPYIFDWDSDRLDGLRNPVALGAGTYRLTLTDSIGCKASAQITLTNPPPLSLACAPALPVTTVRGQDGRAPFTVQGGTPGYTVSWQGTSGGAFVLGQARDTFISGLSSGSYRVRVSDLNGCMDSCSFTIAEPICTLKAEIKRIRDIACYGDAGGALLGIAVQGTAPFIYSWSGPGVVQQKDTLERLPPGQYRLTVTDAIGCADSTSFILATPPPLLAQCTVLNGERTRGGDEGRALLYLSGGTGPVQVRWPGLSPGRIIQPTADSLFAEGLKAGTYFPVFSDQNGCIVQCSFVVDSIICRLRSSAALRHTSCYGTRDGQVTVSAMEGNLPYTFNWSTNARGEGLNTLSSLAAGPYRITITDALNCRDTISVEINSPQPLELSCMPAIQISAFGLNDGSTRIAAKGGTPPYRIQLSGKREADIPLSRPDTTFLEGLYAGSYRSVLQDANGCTDTCIFELTQPPCMTAAELNGTAPGCAGAATGTVSAIVLKARPPLQYNWNVAALNGQPRGSGLPAGSYTLTVTDSVGCSATAGIVLKDPPVLRLGCLLASPASKVNGKDGRMLLDLQGGTPPYRLFLRGGKTADYEITAPGPFTIDTLSRGEYTVSLLDSNGCSTATCTFRIEDPVCTLQTTLIGKHPSCAGFSDGSITTSVANSVGTVRFQWDKAAIANLQSPTGLSSGIYNLRVTDDRLCTDSARIELKDPPLLQMACSIVQAPQTVGGSEGVITVITRGGSGSRTVAWNGPGNIPFPIPDTLNLSGLPAGTYTLRATDTNKCLAECSLTLPAIVCSLDVQAVATQPRCFGDSSGTVRLTFTGAKGTVAFRWSNGSTEQVLRSIPAGTYSATITDAARCEDSTRFFVYNPPPLLVQATLVSGISALDKADASASLSFEGGTPPYKLSYTGPRNGQFIYNTAGKDTLDMLPAGIYSVAIADSLGCLATTGFTIDTFRCTLNAGIRYEAISCETAAISTTVTGAIGAVRYDWDRDEFDGQQNPFPVKSGTYGLKVSDNTGCSIRTVVEVRTSGPMTAELEARDGDCPGDAGSIAIENIKGGRHPYEIALNAGQPRQVGSLPMTLRNIRPGEVRVTLRSNDGCVLDTLVRVNPISAPFLELGSNIEIIKGDSVELRPVIGFIPETMRWNPETGLSKTGGLSVFASPEITTTYQLIVTDPKGCPIEDQISVIVRDQVPVYFPTAFSPNGDGANDYFTGFGGSLIASIEQLNIYDRWGELLFQGTEIPLNTPQNGWDGKVKNGASAPAGVYVFRAVVKLKNGKYRYFAGEVVLIK